MTEFRIVALVAALQIAAATTPMHADPARSRGAGACPIVIVAEDMPLPGGGDLVINLFSSGVINRQKEIAFVGRVSGDERNQGIFVAGPEGLREIIRGCGSTGGQGAGGDCGDPTPIGGTFGGLFDFNNLEPRFNDVGDVLFLADVSGGSSPRGLFLHRNAEQSLVKVVALGDPSPLGGTIEAIGNGALSDQGKVAFLAWDVGTDPFDDSYLALWDDGILEKVVAPGDMTPGGGIVDLVVGNVAGFPDGTSVVLSPTPGFDEFGRLATTVAATSDGILLFEDGVSSWLVREGDSAPGGGFFTSVGIAMLRNGRATFASADPDGTFIGTPGSWQPVWMEGQTLDGEPVAESSVVGGRHVLDDAGEVTLSLVAGDSPVRLIARWNETGGLFPLVAPQDPAPGGGTILSVSRAVSVNGAGDTTFNLFIERSGDFFAGIYRIDDCLLGEIFADGFESGTSDRWDSVLP